MSSRVTVVVATRNRRADLERSLARHVGPVVVVDNGSTDGSPDLVRQSFPWARVVALGENRGAPARNIGVRLARTPYVAFADDDSWWAPGAVSRAADILDSHPRLAVLAGRILVGHGERPDPICAELAASPLGTDRDLPGPNILGFASCGVVVRQDAFLAAGWFDSVGFFGGEEERLALDLATLGWGLAYVDGVVAHHHPASGRDRRARQVLLARNTILTACMRRPWPEVGRCVAAAAVGGGSPARAGLLRAVPRLGRALARRRVVPARVEAARRTLDRSGAADG